MIPFGSWLPDLPDFENPGATVATNVIPHGISYKSFPDLDVYSGALTARCQGFTSGRNASGTTFNFSGDASKLYKLSTTTWSDVSLAGGYSTGSTERWEFTQWGEQILATNFADAIQTFTMGTSSNFAALGGTPPKARHITVIRDFVVTGNTWDSVDGNKPQRVRWCGIGDPTTWTVSASTQADYEDLDGPGGWVQAVVGGEYGVIFQERAISRMTYVGSPAVFQFDTVEIGRGTPAPGSVIKVGGIIYYLGQDGFYAFNGSQSVPIGENQIDKWFFADLDQSYWDRISSAADPINKLIMWSYPGQSNSSGTPNKILVHNYAPDAKYRWAVVEISHEIIGRSLAEGYTLEGLDSVSSSIDSLPFSLDSRAWTGNAVYLSAFNTDHKLTTFTGDALEAVVETSEAMLGDRRSKVTRIRPIVDGASSFTVQIGSRDTLSDSVTWSGASSSVDSGDVPVRANGRYHRARVTITGGFTHAQGIEPEFASEGSR